MKKTVSIPIEPNAYKLLNKLSNGKSPFEDRTPEEKLRDINETIEHILKHNNKYISIDSEKIFLSFIDSEMIKEFRNKTHCFRHTSDEHLKKRREMTAKQKAFLIDYGITILNALCRNMPLRKGKKKRGR